MVSVCCSFCAIACSLLLLLSVDCSPVNQETHNVKWQQQLTQTKGSHFPEFRESLVDPGQEWNGQEELMRDDEQGLRRLVSGRAREFDPDYQVIEAILAGRPVLMDANDASSSPLVMHKRHTPLQELMKRNKLLRLSLTNNIDVLREKLFKEIARRERMQQNQNQIDEANNALTALG